MNDDLLFEFGPMFLRIRFPAVVVWASLGIVLSFLSASSPAFGKDLFSALRSYKNSAPANAGETNGGTALSQHRLARSYADQNDKTKANTYFGLAFQNAAPSQFSAIAADYAAFLSGTGDLHRAELILKQAHAQSPNDIELTKMLARCLVQQSKMVEGLRYFQSVSTESEAKAEIAAIYREQGDTDMLAAVERKWGSAGTARPGGRPEPVLVAAKSTSALSPMLPPPVLPAKMVTPPVVSAVAPAAQPFSGTPLSSVKIPLPVPNPSLQPVATATNVLKPDSAAPVPRLPAPVPVALAARPAVENHTMVNPVKLASAPQAVLAQSDAQKPSRPVSGIQPRRHYVTNAGTSTDLDVLFPIKPVVAVVPVQ